MANDDQDKLQPPRLFGRRKGERPPEAEETEETQVLRPTPERVVQPEPESQPAPEPAPKPVRTPRTPKVKAPKPPKEPKVKAPRPPRFPRLPRERRPLRVNGYAAAALSGLASGLLLVLLTWALLQLTRQGSTIGDRLGLPLLVVIFVVGVAAGALLLRLLKVTSPGTISFLGTGAVAVIAMLGLAGRLDSVRGAVAVVVISVVTYVLARWVTARFIERALDEA